MSIPPKTQNNKMNKTRLMLLLAAGLIAGSPATAKKEKKQKPQTEQAEKKGRKGILFWKKKDKSAQPAQENKPEEKPQIDRPGMFHVTKEKGEWFFQIHDSLIGREFLTTTRYTSTPSNCGQFGGEQINQQTVFFEVAPGENLLLRSRLFINVADTATMINKAITISNESPILNSFKIESHKNQVYKIKVSPYFSGEVAGMGLPNDVKRMYSLQGLNGDKSYIEDIKSFPLNTEVRMVKTYSGNGYGMPAIANTGLATFGLNISFVMLPEKPMTPRHFDKRVGYFTHGYTEFSDHQQQVQGKSFIARFRLEARPEDVARQKAGEAVEPIKPIVYYIDPATPKQWRKYLIQGVNDWQKAFEKAGWKNAIIGKEWPEQDTTMSMEDARFNCIRYLASPIENAYGPHVSDPRTGEIIEAHVCWYHNVMKLVHTWYMVQASSIDEAARKMNYDEELMGQLIRFVSSHEVGHSLGLRHNFGSSSMVPVDSLRSKDWVERHGHTPSIMDYARFNYVAQPEDQLDRLGIFPRINDYDEWAIQWGYGPMAADNADDDHRLREEWVAGKLSDKRLWWGDGEISIGRLDPRNQTEDLGDNAMKASTYGIMNLKRQIVNLPQWTADNTADLYDNDVRTMYDEMRLQFMRYCGHVARNIGGHFVTFQPKGTQENVYAPVPLEQQKEALQWMDENVLTEPVWLRQVPYARRLTPDPHSLTATVAESAITQMMNRLDGMNEFYTPEQYITDLVRLVFKEADSRQSVTPYRVALQNMMITHLTRAFGNGYQPVRPAALLGLQQIQAKAKAASTSAPDVTSRAHWASVYDKIGRVLVWK